MMYPKESSGTRSKLTHSLQACIVDMRIIVMCKVAPVSVFVTRKSLIYILPILHGEQYSVFTFPFPVEVSVIVNSVGALHPECQWCLHRPLRPGSESPLQCQQCEISSATWLRRRDTALICADPGPGQSGPQENRQIQSRYSFGPQNICYLWFQHFETKICEG